MLPKYLSEYLAKHNYGGCNSSDEEGFAQKPVWRSPSPTHDQENTRQNEEQRHHRQVQTEQEGQDEERFQAGEKVQAEEEELLRRNAQATKGHNDRISNALINAAIGGFRGFYETPSQLHVVFMAIKGIKVRCLDGLGIWTTDLIAFIRLSTGNHKLQYIRYGGELYL